MEYIDGIKVSDLDKIKESNLSLKEVDTKLVEAMAFQIFHSGFVHADPHVCHIDFTVVFFNTIIFSCSIARKCLCSTRSESSNQIRRTNRSARPWLICKYQCKRSSSIVSTVESNHIKR